MTQPKLVKDLLESRRVLFGFIFALIRDADATEDIFQEMSLAILDEAAKGTTIGNFIAWARELARHRVADYYRRLSRDKAGDSLPESMMTVIDQAFSESDATPETARARQKFLLECLGRLAPRAREIVGRRYRERLSVKEIASKVGWQASAVKVALSKARRALAVCIQSKVQMEAIG